MIWNLTRCFLVFLCGYQLLQALADVQMAHRILVDLKEGPRQTTQDRAATAPDMELVIEVLGRKSGSSFFWLVALVAVAFAPYKSIRRLGGDPS